MTEIKTASGFVCEIDDEQIFDNYELLELLVQLDKGNRAVLPEVLELILGEGEQVKALKEHLRTKEGKVTTSAVHRELLEIFKSRNELKN